ncbi:MAG: helix-turn-helix domain-containing protein [Bacteroidia bacterium]|nr:helix-turn-helix domain-containing protein [Bacteroidia bacterium]
MHKGLKIKLARIQKGLTQEQLAEKIDKTRPLVSNIEQTGTGNYYTLLKICEVLEIDIQSLENEANETGKSYKGTSYATLQEENINLVKELQLQKELSEAQKTTIQSLQKQIQLLEKQLKKS